MSRPALFLDRDGVINIDHAYVYKKEDFYFISGIFELVAAANKHGYLVIIVTNQAGIGRGYYREEDFHVLMDWVKGQFVSHGGRIDAIYFCPFHPEHGVGDYRRESEWRKPAPGMLLHAATEFDIDLPNSIMVGDKVSDLQAGQSAGVKNLFLLGRSDNVEVGCPIAALDEVVLKIKDSTDGKAVRIFV